MIGNAANNNDSAEWDSYYAGRAFQSLAAHMQFTVIITADFPPLFSKGGR